MTIKVSKNFMDQLNTIKNEIDYRNELINRMVIGAITAQDENFDPSKHLVNLDTSTNELTYKLKEEQPTAPITTSDEAVEYAKYSEPTLV
jgi:hypothetical protein